MRKKKGPLVVKQGAYPKEHRIKANTAWGKINSRCGNPKDPKYKNYGALGIAVMVSQEEFIHWYCQKLEKWVLPLKSASVGRVDHSKGYSLDNIQIESVSHNSIEMHSRRKDYSYFTKAGSEKNKKRILLKDYKTGEHLMVFDSLSDAAKITGCLKSNISCVALGRGKSKSFKNGLFSAEYI